MSLGVTMLFYCVQSSLQKKNKYVNSLIFICAGISIALIALLPLEFKWSLKFEPLSKAIYAGLKIGFYGVVLLFNLAIVGATIYQMKGGKSRILNSMVVITLFALACLVFGVMVSFGDFSSSAKFDSGEYQHKQIICFLMMAIYVGCLLIWKPYISIGILGAIFLGFYLLIDGLASWVSGGRQVPEGDQVNYITFFISLTMICVSIYDQRVSEAKKDEELELLATKDSLTGLYAFEYFLTLISRQIGNDTPLNSKVYLFMDIASFKVFNDQRGFEEGNRFLKEVGNVLTELFPKSLISRQSDDHFAVFTDNKDIDEKLNQLNKKIEVFDLDIRPGIKVGGYYLRDVNEDPHQCIEKARYACVELKRKPTGTLLIYDNVMHDQYRLTQYIVRHIDEAIEKKHIKAFYQPVVWSKGRALCGVEALARWIDPKYGFLSPASFVPALEDAQLIYKLDIAILKIVCNDLRTNLDNNLPAIPASINFSRHDFSTVDIVGMIDEVVKEYNIPKDLLHIEITESALTNDSQLLMNSIKRLHKLGYAVWLDDFGAGYSSFNILKDFEFDVLKLDMKFLEGFETNDKAKVLIRQIILMADEIGIATLCEGVETKEQADFLEEVNCGKLQGYLYGKAYCYDDLKQMIFDKKYTISKELKR